MKSSPFQVSAAAVMIGLLVVSGVMADEPGPQARDEGGGTSSSMPGLGPEIWVDGPDMVQPGVDRANPAVAVDELGRRIYVWNAFLPAGGDRNDIFMRRFDASGNPLDAPFFVNSYTTNDQKAPRVAVAADGSFLVTWESDGTPADVGDRPWVFAQAFDADGNPVGGERQVTTLYPAIPSEISSDVAALRTPDGSPGGYVVVWESNPTNGDDTSGWNTQARLLAPDGTPTGAQFQVNTITAQSQTQPNVAELADGGFLVVFREPAPDPEGVRGRRYDAAGDPIGNDFQISEIFMNGIARPDVALGWDGRVAVVWEDDEESGDDHEIRARLYQPIPNPAGPDPEMNPLGTDFRVNTLATGTQRYPNVGDYGPEGFLVTWHSSEGVTPGDDDSSFSVQARLITGHATFAGDQEQLNVYTDGSQARAGTAGWYGRLASTYRSASNDETADDVITARQIEHCLFCDDFEWFHPGGPDSLWRWTSSLGLVP